MNILRSTGYLFTACVVYQCEIVVDKKPNFSIGRVMKISLYLLMPVLCFLFLLVAGVVLWWRNLLVKTVKAQLSSQNTSVGCSRKK